MKIFSIDYSESPAIAARFGITRLPTLIHGLPGGVFRDISTHRNELTSLLNDKEKLLAISTTSLGPFSIYGDFMNSIGQTGSRLAEMIESLLRQPTYILILLALLMVFAVVALAYLLVFLHETIFPSQTDNIGYKKLPTREEMLSEELKSDEEIDSEQETSDPSQSLNSIEFSSDESDQGDNEDGMINKHSSNQKLTSTYVKDASPSETTIISEGKNKQLADDDGFITVRRRK